MRQWLVDDLAEELAASLRPFAAHDARLQRAAPLQVPSAPAHRLPRHPGRRRSDGDDGGAVAPGRRVPGRGLALGPGDARAPVRVARRRRRDAHRPRRHRDGQARRRRAQLLLGHRPDLRLRRGRRDDGRSTRERRQRRVLRRGGADHRGRARVGDRRGLRLPRGPPPASRGTDGRARSCRSRATAPTSPTGRSCGSARRSSRRASRPAMPPSARASSS